MYQVLMRSEDDLILHACNNDISDFGNKEIALPTLVIRHRANGYHAVTQYQFPALHGLRNPDTTSPSWLSTKRPSISRSLTHPVSH